MRFKKGQIPWNKGMKGVQKAWNKGIPCREETKKKLSEAKKGIPLSEEHKRKISDSLKGIVTWNKGKTGIFSKEALEKMSRAHKGRIVSEETRRKIGNANRGRVFSKETRKRMSERMKGKESPCKGQKRTSMQGKNNPFYGKKHTLEIIEKIRKAHLGKKCSSITKQRMRNSAHRGKDNIMCRIPQEQTPNWQGGISYQKYPKEFVKGIELKEEIRERDNRKCQLCGMLEEEHLKKYNRKLCVNHIDFDKMNCKKNNLNTLCIGCNAKVNFNREYWTQYFQEQLII